MSLFDQFVTEALKNQPNLSSLRIVVEKELLHHDILRILSEYNLLVGLTFIGETCLRTCYGGVRLSEDLDFTGGEGFTRKSLLTMGRTLAHTINEKYGLEVIVKEPVKDINNVATWKIKIETRPKQSHLPAQRINLDICAVPSYEKQPMLLLNPYGVYMGTSGLVIQAQSREEIYADKLLAVALRPNRLKYRDLWDIAWLHQQGLKPRFELIPRKLKDRKIGSEYFIDMFKMRQILLADGKLKLEFENEMRRFLSLEHVNKVIQPGNLWASIVHLIADLNTQLRQFFG